MFIAKTTKKVGDKVHYSYLLSESFRQGGKVKHRTLLNISRWSQEQRDALALALKGNKLHSLDEINSLSGKRVGALWVFKELAHRLGLLKALSACEHPELALILIISRIITQGSRLHCVEWGKLQELENVVGVSDFNEDALYRVLEELAVHQEEIEQSLFTQRHNKMADRLFLYDVTSSYLEGKENELAAFGYNRDKKQGKKQIVIGLLTNKAGYPVSIEVFKGNTPDQKTLSSQINKLKQRFTVSKVTMVGDRGMIKSAERNEIIANGFSYITAITKPQVKTLLKAGALSIELFDEEVSEVEYENVRYLLRRNPIRVDELSQSRREKLKKVEDKLAQLNQKLSDRPRSSLMAATKTLDKLIVRLKIQEWLSVGLDTKKRELSVFVEKDKLAEVAKLDGCYVIKTNVPSEELSATEVHQKYKDLAMVEKAFRTIKTGCLEVRPIFVRKDNRTRGHIVVSMLAYMLAYELRKQTADLGIALSDIIDILDSIQTVILSLPGQSAIKVVPKPSEIAYTILRALNIELPKSFKIVDTT
jgi:transposase